MSRVYSLSGSAGPVDAPVVAASLGLGGLIPCDAVVTHTTARKEVHILTGGLGHTGGLAAGQGAVRVDSGKAWEACVFLKGPTDAGGLTVRATEANSTSARVAAPRA